MDWVKKSIRILLFSLPRITIHAMRDGHRVHRPSPLAPGRLAGAATVLGMTESGVARIRVELISSPESTDDVALLNKLGDAL